MDSANYKPLPPLDYLNECFRYCSQSGSLFWKQRPREHFNTIRGFRSFNSQFANKETSRVTNQGYKSVYLTLQDKKHELSVHRIAWALYYESDPGNFQIDHINKNPGDNRIVNLRLATAGQNTRNTRARTGTSRFKGVYFDKSKNKWKSQYQLNGKRKHIGYYSSQEAAATAFNHAAHSEYKEFANLNKLGDFYV